MKTFNRVLVLILLLVISVSAQKKIIFVETSDVHGEVFAYDFLYDKESKGSLTRVNTFVDSLRADKDNVVILLDNGDILQGTPLVYYYNFIKTDTPHLYAEVMNYLKYDAATVGNHDIEPGHPVYDKFVNDVKFPWLCANAIDVKTGKPYFKPYTVINKGSKKIAVLGLITPGIPNWLPPVIWEGIRFEDMKKTAEKWVKIIKEKENPDLLVGLFHSGKGKDDESKVLSENASLQVAKFVPGFDIVFTGHDHQDHNKVVTNTDGKEVVLVGPTSKGKNVAVVEYDYSTMKVTNHEYVSMANKTPSPKLNKQFEAQFNEIKSFVNEELGVFTKEVDSRSAIMGNSAFTDLIHRVQLDVSGADISFAAPLSMNAKIEKGPVYIKDMFKLYKYENLLYTVEMTGAEIDDYLEYSVAQRYKRIKGKSEHLLKFDYDKEGNLKTDKFSGGAKLKHLYFNFDDAAGINYTVDLSKKKGKRVKISTLANGDKFNKKKKYKVAVNSYRGSGGGGHFAKGCKIDNDELKKRIVGSTEKDLRFYIMEWIKKEKNVTPLKVDNWKLVPEDKVKELYKKDYKILFDK